MATKKTLSGRLNAILDDLKCIASFYGAIFDEQHEIYDDTYFEVVDSGMFANGVNFSFDVDLDRLKCVLNLHGPDDWMTFVVTFPTFPSFKNTLALYARQGLDALYDSYKSYTKAENAKASRKERTGGTLAQRLDMFCPVISKHNEECCIIQDIDTVDPAAILLRKGVLNGGKGYELKINLKDFSFTISSTSTSHACSRTYGGFNALLKAMESADDKWVSDTYSSILGRYAR